MNSSTYPTVEAIAQLLEEAQDTPVSSLASPSRCRASRSFRRDVCFRRNDRYTMSICRIMHLADLIDR